MTDHLELPAHPSTNMREHVRTRHGLDGTDPVLDAADLAAWHAAQHPAATDSQLDTTDDLRFPDGPRPDTTATLDTDITVTRAISPAEIHDLIGDPTREPDRVPTDPAFRPRRKATPSGDTTGALRLGRTVWFRSRTGTYTMPAMITAVPESLYPPNVEAGHVPPITADSNVHLAVFTCGIPGEVSATTAEQHPELADPARLNRPAGGTFAEWDIPEWVPDHPVNVADWDFTAQPAGTWTWPVAP